MLRQYLEETEHHVQKAKADEIFEYCEALRVEKEPRREEDDICLHAAEEQAIEERHAQFLRFQRYALFMLAAMIFEASAKEFCKYVREPKRLSLNVGDLQGNFSQKLKVYLCRYAKVSQENWPGPFGKTSRGYSR